MVQKRVTAQGWLGSTPEGQRPQIRGLRVGGSLAVASAIPATQLSSPARLAERVVTPHAPMTLGANHVSRAQNGGDPAAAGDLRLGHAWRRASIPLHALITLWSALGAFCLLKPRGARIWPGNLRNICSDICRCEFRESQQISTFYEPSVQAMETRLGARQRRRPPTVHRGRTHAPRLQRPVASENEASACSELRLGCHPETPVIELCQTKPNSSGVSRWQIVTWDELPRNHAAKTNPSMRGRLSSEAVQILCRRAPAHPLRRRLRSIWPISDLSADDSVCTPRHIL